MPWPTKTGKYEDPSVCEICQGELWSHNHGLLCKRCGHWQGGFETLVAGYQKLCTCSHCKLGQKEW